MLSRYHNADRADVSEAMERLCNHVSELDQAEFAPAVFDTLGEELEPTNS
jgi:hypothetical protein